MAGSLLEAETEAPAKTEQPKNDKANKLNMLVDFIQTRYKIFYNEMELDYYLNDILENKLEKLDKDLLAYILADNGFTGFKDLLNPIIKTLGRNNNFHPIKAYFEHIHEKPYNPEKEPDYIGKLCEHIELKDNREMSLFKKHFMYMLVRSIKQVFLDHYFNKQAFILLSSAQNIGKSSFFRYLIPNGLESYYSEDFNIDKDGKIAICTNWIINIDEMSALSKFDIRQLKAFMSKDSIKERLPYDAKATKNKRTANFVGTTNDIELLSDPTGSVRFIIFEIEKINFNYSQTIDVDNIWRQAYYLFDSNNRRYAELTKEDIHENEERNKKYTVRTPEMELLMKYFKPSSKEKGQFMMTSEMYKHIMDKTSYAHKLNPINLGKALAFYKFTRDKEGDRYGYYVMETGEI